MFDLKRPCVNCPFRKGVGETFRMPRRRLTEIVGATAFQCHKTVDYSGDEPGPGDRPQQCAGLMTVLHRAGCPNQMMQVAQRLGFLDPDQFDPKEEAYASLDEMFEAHGGKG